MQTYFTMHLLHSVIVLIRNKCPFRKITLFLSLFTSECKETSSAGGRAMSLCLQAIRGCGHIISEASPSPDFPVLQRLSSLTSDLFTLYWAYWSRKYSKACPDILLSKPHRAPESTSSLSSVIQCCHPLWHAMDMPWPYDIWCLESNFLTMHNIKLTTVFCLKEPNLCYRTKYTDSNNYRLLRNETIQKTSKMGAIQWQCFNNSFFFSWQKRNQCIQ